jgi:catechol 2,3-dioxygenase-like lactoylglutathione lyase family enzyme
MAFHHVAIATRDVEATHRFYTDATGFALVRVEAVPTEKEPGWAKHLFYDTGGGEMLAVWDIHDASIADFRTEISTALGLPVWVNHIAFAARDLDDLEARKQRWLEHGHDVARADHGWCASVYAVDPNGILVEFCATTRAFTAADHSQALEMLAAAAPPVAQPAPLELFAAGAAATS